MYVSCAREFSPPLPSLASIFFGRCNEDIATGQEEAALLLLCRGLSAARFALQTSWIKTQLGPTGSSLIFLLVLPPTVRISSFEAMQEFDLEQAVREVGTGPKGQAAADAITKFLIDREGYDVKTGPAPRTGPERLAQGELAKVQALLRK